MTRRKAFLAGATGVIGMPLTRMLIDAGWQVVGMTRRASSADALRALGAEAVVVDVFDAQALAAAVAGARPDVVIHQLTDLPSERTPDAMAQALGRNARLRVEGTRNLVSAALAAGCHRVVAQSIAWAYAYAPLAHAESDPLDLAAEGERATTVRAIATLESLVLETPGLSGAVLRYGKLYGPGTWSAERLADMPLHVEDAARAALLAAERPGAVGAFNVSEPDAGLSTERARTVLGWEAQMAMKPA